MFYCHFYSISSICTRRCSSRMLHRKTIRSSIIKSITFIITTARVSISTCCTTRLFILIMLMQTFITINKTSKKVDTSLAYVLKNKLSVFDGNMAMTRAEYLAVEVARYINETPNKFWVDCILYEGAIKQSNRYISLNSFVRATRIFINSLAKLGLVDINWHSKEDVERLKELIADIIIHIWDCVYRRWPELTDSRLEDKQILQGSIGYTAITRTIVTTSRLYHFANIDDYKAFVESIVMDFRVDYYNWLRGSTFSKYSSETGYKLVSDVLLRKL